MISLFHGAGAAVLIQGITGRTAARHAELMRGYGTGLVAGVAPGRGGRTVAGVPVFDTVAAAVAATGARTSVAFLPPAAVADGLVEAAEAGIGLSVHVTEGVAVHDLLDGLDAARQAGMRVLGPNCPGLLSAGRYLLGFLPASITVPGPVAVLARSGTLSYEAVYALRRHGLGVSIWAGVGGDRVKGSTFADLLPHVLDDARTEALVLVGEIGGTDEEDVSGLLAACRVPCVALLAGATAPQGITFGHAGAIVDGGVGGIDGKRQRLENAGVLVVDRPAQIPAALAHQGVQRSGVAALRPAARAVAGPPRTMTGGEAIVAALRQGGVDTVFTLPGVQIYGLVDALARAGTAVRVFVPRHEQAAAYMALGYAKSTGRTGVYAVVPGPGLLNSAAGLAAAHAGSTPLLCVTGQVPSRFLGAGLGHLHEMPDQLATLRTVTRWAARIDRPADAPALVAQALRQARDGRPLPVALEMAWDVFDQHDDVALPAPVPPGPAALPGHGALQQAAELLARARHPMLVVGSGAFGAVAEVRALAEHLQAPVVSYRSGRGIVPSDHHLGFSCAEGFARWPETDVLVGIGSRLELVWYRWPERPRDLEIIDINLDPEHAGRVGAGIPLVGDAAATAAALLRVLGGTPRPSRRAEFDTLKAATREQIRRLAPHAGHLAAIRAVLPRDGFFVDDMCQAGFASCYAFPVYRPRTFVSFGGFGALGHGYPTALGVKAAHPGQPVVAVCGDGGFQFGLPELGTAMQYGLDVVAVVFNNQAYGNVLRDQETGYGGRVLGARLRNPDFVALARSYDMHAERAATPEALSGALGRALERREPALIEVPVDPRSEPSPWPFIQPPAAAQGWSG